MRRGKLYAIAILILVGLARYRVEQLDARPQTEAAANSKLEGYVIPFSHLDLFWGGTREEDLARGNRIIAKALLIAREHPEFHFELESDNFVANFMESHKGASEAEELERLVKEGRFEIAPMWANIFLNMPSGEVLARNILYGTRYAHDMFGVDERMMHPTDIPGFPSQYPQILREAEIPFMVMSRMGPKDKPLFDWESPDGSKVRVWSVRGYGLGAHFGLHRDLTDENLQAIRKELIQRYGAAPGPVYIHWGVDLWAPTEKLVENVNKLNRSFPEWHFQLATPHDFYNAAAEKRDLPILSGEIPVGWPHVVDGILHLWQWAPPATNALTTAETFAAINYASGYADYPRHQLEVMWKDLIESMDHNHDGQGGTIGDNRKKEFSQLSIIRGGEILRDMVRNIAERVRNPIGKGFPLVVFNGRGWKRDDVVKAHMTLYGDITPADIAPYKKGLRLVDETGASVPFDLAQTSDNISRAVDVVFVARRVPSLGYKTYFLLPAQQMESLPAASQISLDRDKDLKDPRRPIGSEALENQFYKVTVDKATGGVSVFDKQLGRNVAKDMQIVGVEERGTNNVQPEIDTGRTISTSINGTSVEENNAVRTVFKISGWLADIPITQRLILYQGLKRVDIENSLDWKEPRMVRIEQLFPLQQQNSEMVYGVPYGANSVKDLLPGASPSANDEISEATWKKYRTIQGWVFAGTSEWGVTVAADHQLVELENGLIRANMIRGQRYTSVKIVRGDEVTSMDFPPAGHYVFKYSLSSGPGDWKAARSYQAGHAFNSPLIPVEVVDDISPKSLPPTHSFCSVQGGDLVITALKKSESDGSVILRLYEIAGDKAETPVTFLGRQQTVRETNLLEQDSRLPEERVVRLNPYQIKTLKLRLGQ